jgi:hypothetical protein
LEKEKECVVKIITLSITRGIVLLAIVSALCAINAPVSAARFNAADFAAIDSYIEAQMKNLSLPGLSLGVVQGDQMVHFQGFGIADPSGRKITPQTPFLLASLTKSFTALAIMQLVDGGWTGRARCPRAALSALVQRRRARRLSPHHRAPLAESDQRTVHIDRKQVPLHAGYQRARP